MEEIKIKSYNLVKVENNIAYFKMRDGTEHSIHLSKYKKYNGIQRSSEIAHLLDSDFRVFLSINKPLFRPTQLKIAHMCPVHSENLGCKFNPGRVWSDEFKHKHKDCRCWARFATQFEYDLSNYKDYKNNIIPINDNVRIFTHLAFNKDFN